MKLDASIALLLQLLTTLAQQGSSVFHISKLDDVNGNAVPNHVLSQLAMGFANAGQSQTINQMINVGNSDNGRSGEVTSKSAGGTGAGDPSGGSGSGSSGTDSNGSSGTSMGSDAGGSGGSDATPVKIQKDL